MCIGSPSPTFSTLTRGISPTDFVKASIFSTSLMLRASGMGMPAFSPGSSFLTVPLFHRVAYRFIEPTLGVKEIECALP